MRTVVTWLQIKVAAANAGISCQSASRIPCGLEFQFSGGVGIQQIIFEYPALDDDGAPRWHAFAIEGRGAEAADHGSVVDDGDVVAGDLLS